jgi:hypothetical protein
MDENDMDGVSPHSGSMAVRAVQDQLAVHPLPYHILYKIRHRTESDLNVSEMPACSRMMICQQENHHDKTSERA